MHSTSRRTHEPGAGCRIRTYEGISQQIYSLSCLTASLTLLVGNETKPGGFFSSCQQKDVTFCRAALFPYARTII